MSEDRRCHTACTLVPRLGKTLALVLELRQKMNATVGIANKEPSTCIICQHRSTHSSYNCVATVGLCSPGHTGQHCPGGVVGLGQLGGGHSTALQSICACGSVECSIHVVNATVVLLCALVASSYTYLGTQDSIAQEELYRIRAAGRSTQYCPAVDWWWLCRV